MITMTIMITTMMRYPFHLVLQGDLVPQVRNRSDFLVRMNTSCERVNGCIAEYEYYEDTLPSGPTSEPPLPSGPTRRPGQPRTSPPKHRNTLSPALNQFLNLPFLTTQRPRRLKPTKVNPNKKLLKNLGPFHQHFIAPPKLNAGIILGFRFIERTFVLRKH